MAAKILTLSHIMGKEEAERSGVLFILPLMRSAPPNLSFKVLNLSPLMRSWPILLATTKGEGGSFYEEEDWKGCQANGGVQDTGEPGGRQGLGRSHGWGSAEEPTSWQSHHEGMNHTAVSMGERPLESKRPGFQLLFCPHLWKMTSPLWDSVCQMRITNLPSSQGTAGGLNEIVMCKLPGT